MYGSHEELAVAIRYRGIGPPVYVLVWGRIRKVARRRAISSCIPVSKVVLVPGSVLVHVEEQPGVRLAGKPA